MKKLYKALASFLLFALCAFYAENCNAQQGKNGPLTVSTNSVANEYTFLTADAGAGNTSITVNNSSLNTNERFAAPLAEGDLIMIIQMQGASINGTSNDSTWGAITNYNNCGLYEFSEIASVPNGTTIDINCPLKNNYTTAGNVQIVRVPRLSSLTINNGGVLSCDAWNGTQGGIVALEVQGNTVIDAGGRIDVSALGFRGAAIQDNSGQTSNMDFYSQYNYMGGAKGEGIAGYSTQYNDFDGGMFGRGAPANGGGGGDQWNASGGGGANAGNINAYTGDGNPDTSTASWITAWNLEGGNFAYSGSSGGGRGGYTIAWYPMNYPSPLVNPPGDPNWGPDGPDNVRNRQNAGGKGGRSLDYSTGRIFFGGGGGAGHEDQSAGGNGGNGAGIAYLVCYGTVSGSGSIWANGQKGLDDNSQNTYGDGSGGGGGGGTVIIYSLSNINGIGVQANGGVGGNQYINYTFEAEGPGAGGGGGYVATSGATITETATGGANGATNSVLMVLFTPNGATKGGAGLANQVINSIPFSSVTANVSANVSVCSGDSTALSATGGTNYLWSPDTGLSCTNCANPVAAPMQTTTYIVTVSSGSCMGLDSVTVSVLPNVATGTIVVNQDSICPGSSLQLIVNGATGNIQWQSSTDGVSFANIPDATSDTLNSNNLFQNTYYRIQISGFCGLDSSQAAIVNVLSLPIVGTPSAEPDTICSGGSTQLTASGTSGNIQWQSSADGVSFVNLPGAGSSTYNINNINETTYYRVATSNNCGLDSSQAIQVEVLSLQNIGNIIANPDTICAGGTFALNLNGNPVPVQWQVTDSTGNFTSIGGADSISYTTFPLYQSVSARVIINNQICADTSSSINLVVNPVPVPPVLSAADSLICASDSTRINSSGSYSSYHWNDGDTRPYTFASGAGGYWVTVTNAYGCSAVSGHQYISVYPVPQVSIEASGDTLNSLNAVSYQWYFNDTAISGAIQTVYIARQTGNYAVLITDTNGCTEQSSNVPITVSGIADVFENNGLNIYPNPFTNTIFIQSKTAASLINCIEIYDMTGRIIIDKNFSNAPLIGMELDVKILTEGLYYLRVKTNDGDYSQKLVKQ